MYNNILEDNNRIKKTEQSIIDYYQNQQTFNFRIPNEYDSILNELENTNISLKKIDQKYCKSELFKNKIKIVLFRLIRKIRKR